jgi:hypothetical protein
MITPDTKHYWELRKAGKYEEARQFLLTVPKDNVHDKDMAWEQAALVEEGLLGLPEAALVAQGRYLWTASLGHQAANVSCAIGTHTREFVHPMPAIEDLTCPLARAMWYHFRSGLVSALDSTEEKERLEDAAQSFYLQAAQAGHFTAMPHCGIEWIKHGTTYGHLECLEAEMRQTKDPVRYYELVKKAAFQGHLDSIMYFIEPFCKNFIEPQRSKINRTWNVGWRDGARAILSCPDPGEQLRLLLNRFHKLGPYGGNSTHWWQEMYMYSVSPIWPCTCADGEEDCRCFFLDIPLKPMVARRHLAGRDEELCAGLNHVRQRVELSSGRAALLLYCYANRMMSVPKDVAIMLARLVLHSRQEHADVWAETATE